MKTHLLLILLLAACGEAPAFSVLTGEKPVVVIGPLFDSGVSDAGAMSDGGNFPADAAMPDGGGPSDGGSGDSGVSDSGVRDSGVSDGGSSALVYVPATSGNLTIPFGVTISGQGSSHIGAISIAGNVGTVVVDGVTLKTVVYENIAFSAASSSVLQALVVAPDRWYVAFFYCSSSMLTGLYLEGTSGPVLEYETASGSCVATTTATPTSVMFPEVNMPVTMLTPHFSVSGPQFSYTPGMSGSLTLGSSTFEVLPFSVVDCATVCGGNPGWYELHAVLWNRAANRACFGIFYLFTDHQRPIQLSYSLSLPDLMDPAGTVTFPNTTWAMMP